MPEGRPEIPREIQRRVLVEAGHRCAIPTCRQTPVELAHIKPWAKVKEHSFENLIALCPTCHSRYDTGEINRLSMLAYKRNLASYSSSNVVSELLQEKICKRSLMKFIDEIYVDRERIKSYAQQANLRNLLRQSPEWIYETCFSVSDILNRFVTLDEQNCYAKISQIVQHMKDTNDIAEGRPNRQGKGTPQFWIENCTATRAYFEPNGYSGLRFSIWVSHEDEQEDISPTQEDIRKLKEAGQDVGKLGKLFLLENFESKDTKYMKRVSSPYSFLYNLRLILKSKLEGTDNQQELYRDGLAEELAKEPLKALKSLGAEIYQKRKISVIYKIRNLFPEFFYLNRYQFTVIGYPILIADNRAENNLKLQDLLP